MPPVLLLLAPYVRPVLPWLAVGAAILAVLAWTYHRGDLAARREAERAALITQERARDRMDDASRRYERDGGAAGRLRDGAF